MRIVDDPAYFGRLRKAAVSRKIHPSIEIMLWHYAKGKPKAQVTAKTPATMSDRELLELAGPALEKLRAHVRQHG